MRANISSLVQEWNVVEKIFSSVLLDCKNNSIVASSSLPQQQHGDILNADILRYSNDISDKVNTELQNVKVVSADLSDLSPKESMSPCHKLITEKSCMDVTEATTTMIHSSSVSTPLALMSAQELPIIEGSSTLCDAMQSSGGPSSLPGITQSSENSLRGDHKLSNIATPLCDHTSNSANRTATNRTTPPSFHDVTFQSPNSRMHTKAEQQAHPAMVQVCRSDLDRLTAEAMMLKECLPMVVNAYYISCVGRVPVLEERLGETRREKEGLALQCKNLRRRNDLLMGDLEEGKKEFFSIKVYGCKFKNKKNYSMNLFSRFLKLSSMLTCDALRLN